MGMDILTHLFDGDTDYQWKTTTIQISEGQEPEKKDERKEAEEFIRVDLRNEALMDNVITNYNTKKGAAILAAWLCPIVTIVMVVVGFILQFSPLCALGFVLFMPSFLISMEFLERGKECQKELKDYREAAVILDQIKVKKIDIDKKKNNLEFYFMRDDGTLKKRSFRGFTFEHVSYLEKDHMEVDMNRKLFLISGKYLID